MNTRTQIYTGFFYRALIVVTLAVPMLLVVAAGFQPSGERGSIIVNGLGALLAIVATALVLHAAYRWGGKHCGARLNQSGYARKNESRRVTSFRA